jgi:hypothetical protein
MLESQKPLSASSWGFDPPSRHHQLWKLTGSAPASEDPISFEPLSG